MPPLIGLVVARSPIHGYGVFASRAFAAGEIVIHGDGVLFKDDEEFDDEYALVLPEVPEAPGAIYYDLADQTRWINHSCAPTCAVDARWDAELGNFRTWWVALRPVAAGEEITYDYAFTAHLAIPCRCGAPGCRGLIVDPDEVAEVPVALQPLLRYPLAPRSRA